MLVGIFIQVVITLFACALLTGWRYLPSPLGEWMGMFAGVISTPFLMEGFFITFGFAVVLWLNHYRREREGDEWVELHSLEESESGDPDSKSDS